MFNSGSRRFASMPSPWLDLATASMPVGHRDALAWSEYIYEQHPTFRQAMERIISYFLTDIEINSLDPDRTSLGNDEKEKCLGVLREELDVLGAVQALDRDCFAYGNGFISLYEPFDRMLHCRCGAAWPLEEVGTQPSFKFEFSRSCEFHMTCPKCNQRGAAIVRDIPVKDPSRFRLHLWSPKEIEIANDLISGKCRYLWRIPQDYRQKVLKGSLLELMGANKELLDAIRDGCQLFQFADDVIFHMKEPTLSGIRNNGWGISRVFRNYRDIWFTQLLRCQIEAFAVDFVMPLRVVTPDIRPGTGGASGGRSTDPFMTTDMGAHTGRMAGMFRNKRFDMNTWNFLPFPVKATLLGGDAQQLIPKELYDQAVESLLNATGTPVELYRGTLKLETAMVGLRLFESTNFSLVHANNMFLRWLARRLAARLGWDLVRLSMKRVTYADDFNVSMMLAQLMMQQQVSKETFFKTLGIDAKTESRQIAEQTRDDMTQQAAIQQEMEQSAFGQQIASGQLMGQPGAAPGQAQGQGQPAAGGDPNAAAQPGLGVSSAMSFDPNVPLSPTDIKAQAQQLAQELWAMPESQKDSELRQLKQKNELLHQATKAALEDLRRQAQLAGGEMLKQQQTGVMG